MLFVHRLIVMKMAEQPVMVPGPVFDLLQKVGQPVRLGVGDDLPRLKCSPSQGQNHLTHCGSIPAGCSPVEMYS